jgi:hypothetical protein
MLAPQPIPVSLLEGDLVPFFVFEGAGEEGAWPFTSKVWAALKAAKNRTASRIQLRNADCTILFHILPDLNWRTIRPAG